MEFEGTVYKIMPVTKGTSARGDWQRQDVVFEMQDGPYTRKICVTFFNKPDDVARLKEGAAYNVSVNIESREYNGRWYTDVRPWRITLPTAPGAVPGMPAQAYPAPQAGYQAPAAQPYAAPAGMPQQPAAQAPEFPNAPAGGDTSDDLPF